MNTPMRLVTRHIVMLSLLMGAVTGCSDKSRLNLIIDNIHGSNSGNDYMEADLRGNFSSAHCAIIQDPATVECRIQSPLLTVNGPTYGAWVTGYHIDYYYTDPNDGSLHGPVSNLSISASNARWFLPSSGDTVGIIVPMVSYSVKGWAVGVSCTGVAGFPGPGMVSRMIGKVTVFAEDETGKKMTASGEIQLYLYDFGDYPQPPVGGVLAVGDECFGDSLQADVSTACN